MSYVHHNDVDTEEAQSLLYDTEAELPVHSTPITGHQQPSFSGSPLKSLPHTPRALNRVRFEVQQSEGSQEGRSRRPPQSESWSDKEDDFSQTSPRSRSRSRSPNTGQRAPLLTEIEAPSVIAAGDGVPTNFEELLENVRPKSGLISAFMNMANSIMYV